jgi:hypothetical protein
VKKGRPILQVLPRLPGKPDGVGDYALTLAERLRENHGLETTFVAAQTPAVEVPSAFPGQFPFRELAGRPMERQAAIILHYVNYGYGRRGIPLWLQSALRRVKSAGPILTIFHELYASGSWCQSAFWLRPLQIRIARQVAELSEAAIVSNEVSRRRLQKLAPRLRTIIHPVTSNLGEPKLGAAQIAARDPHRWAICGGHDLIERSLRSFLKLLPHLESWCAPRDLYLLGGKENPRLRQLAEQQQSFKTHFYPQVSAAVASGALDRCAFGWIDYFVRTDESIAAILKSSAFAALCAHGVIGVTPLGAGSIGLGSDRLPGPFFLAPHEQRVPSEGEWKRVGLEIHSWYQRNASSDHLAATVAEAVDNAA